jgi:multiple sugar transport system permease protein
MATAQLRTKTRMTHSERRRLIQGLLFISPWLIGFLLFTIYPLASSLYYSFTRYDLLRDPVFIGMKNYISLFTTDSMFWVVMYNTMFYVLLAAPAGVASAFLMAALLNTKLVGRPFFRAIFFFPAIVPTIVTAVVWQFLLNVQFGLFNSVLQSLQLPTVPFLSNPAYAKPSLVMIYIWAQGNAIVIFLAALQDVPRQLYEAAEVDGARAWHKFRHITIPLTTPVILFNLIMGFIYAFQEFTLPWLLTGGGPANATEFYTIYLYRNAFQFLRMGKASALAWILFIIIVVFTAILFKTSARWVFYNTESE